MGDGKCARERRVDGAEGAVIFGWRHWDFRLFPGPFWRTGHISDTMDVERIIEMYDKITSSGFLQVFLFLCCFNHRCP